MKSIQQPDAEFAEGSRSSRRSNENRLSEAVIGSAIEVQRTLGVGLLESAYAAALEIELQSRGLKYERERAVVASYKGRPVGVAYRADFIVEERLLVELKAVEATADVHRSQVLSYLRLSGLKLGLLINFHSAPLAGRGITRVVNQL